MRAPLSLGRPHDPPRLEDRAGCELLLEPLQCFYSLRGACLSMFCAISFSLFPAYFSKSKPKTICVFLSLHQLRFGFVPGAVVFGSFEDVFVNFVFFFAEFHSAAA